MCSGAASLTVSRYLDRSPRNNGGPYPYGSWVAETFLLLSLDVNSRGKQVFEIQRANRLRYSVDNDLLFSR